MAEKVYFGVPGNIQEIPAPKSGMGFDSNTDVEVTNLVNGGRSVYRAPTAYKTFNMTWQTSSDRLRHLIDLYNGQFGPGPFYISDPTANQENVLPARWSSSWQLAHQSNGWCRPIIDTDDGIPVSPMPTVYRTDRYVTFKQVAAGANVKLEGVVRTRLIRIPGKPYYLSVAGSATGGAAIKVRGFSSATNTWTTLTTFTTFTGATVSVLAASNTNITMLELDLYMPLGSTLTLKGMALGTVDHSAVLNVLRTNLFGNPSFETASGTVNVRTNLYNQSTILIGAGASQTAGVTFSGSTWTRLSTTTASHGLRALTNLADLVNGAIYEAEWELANDGAAAVSVALDWCDSAQTVFTLAAGERRRCKVTGVTGITYNDTYRFSDLELQAANTSILFREILIEKDRIQGPYFDGSTTAAGDFTYAWSSGASHQRAVPVDDTDNGNCHDVSSTEWKLSGTKSLRQIPNALTQDSFSGLGGDIGAMRLGMVAGKTYTISATCRLAAPQTGAFATAARTIRFFYRIGTGSYLSVDSAQAPNVAGSTRLSVTFTLPSGTTEAFVRLQNGAPVGGGDVWWDDVLVEETSTLADYFDGSFTDSHDQDRYYRWTGTANNSTSVVTDEIPTDWMPVGQGIGAVQFGDTTGGELVSSAIDRIGLSLDFTEVQNVESLML